MPLSINKALCSANNHPKLHLLTRMHIFIVIFHARHRAQTANSREWSQPKGDGVPETRGWVCGRTPRCRGCRSYTCRLVFAFNGTRSYRLMWGFFFSLFQAYASLMTQPVSLPDPRLSQKWLRHWGYSAAKARGGRDAASAAPLQFGGRGVTAIIKN